MIKKVISFVLLLSAILALTACGGPDYSDYRVLENTIGAEKYDDKELCAYLFKPDDADARLEIVDAKKGKVVQSYDFPEVGVYYMLFEIEYAQIGAVFQDMNFDGYKDLYIPCCTSGANLEGMAWLWDKESCKFVLSDELCEIYGSQMIYDDKDLIEDAVEGICDEEKVTWYTNVSRIKRKITDKLGKRAAEQYIIKRGEDGLYRISALAMMISR